MKKILFLIFNHHITSDQADNARADLGTDTFVPLPEHLKPLWQQIPPDLAEITDYLEPIKRWLLSQADQGDYALIQGDFGACYVLVNAAFENGLIPVYSTTERKAREVHSANGDVELTHSFRHVAFRRYEQFTGPKFGIHGKG